MLQLFLLFDVLSINKWRRYIFGLKSIRQDGDGDFVVDGRKLSGPFGDELIVVDC